MVDEHSQNFFGQKTGLILSSNAKNDPYVFIRCLRKKKNGKWENFSESKVVKISLLELVSIYDVVDHKRKLWNTFHQFNDIKTPISFAWDEYDDDLLWINIDNYSRPLNYPQTELLRRILHHLIDEKIEFSTIREEYNENRQKQKSILRENKKKSKKVNSTYGSSVHEQKQDDFHVPTQDAKHSYPNNKSRSNDESSKLTAKIKIGRQKALLLILKDGKEIWVPKSTILSPYNEDDKSYQEFTVKNWILEKRNLISAT